MQLAEGLQRHFADRLLRDFGKDCIAQFAERD